MSPEPPASERRVHPAAIGGWAVEGIKSGGALAAIPGLLQAREGLRGLLIVAAITIGIFVIIAVLQYLRFRYILTEDALVVRGGVLFRFERTIPAARIQSIDSVQKLRHRLFRVVELRVEAIGGGSTEATLHAVAPAEADRIRDRMLRTALVPDEVREAAPLVTLGPGRTFLAGLTGGRVAALAIVGSIIQDFIPDDMLSPERLEQAGVPPVAVAAIFAAGVLLVALILSLIMTVLVFWRFTVRREEDRLVITRGLLDRRRSVVPLRRIQAFQIHENLIRRAFGLASVTVTVAGYAGAQQEVQASSTLLPLGTRRDADDLVSGLLPDPIRISDVALEPAPRRALRRRISRGLAVGLIIGTALLFSPAGSPAGYLAVLVTVPLAFPAYRALGHAVAEPYVLARAGLLVRTTSVVPTASVQVVRVQASPLQRIAGLASVKLKVPKASVTAHDLDRPRAEARMRSLRAAMVDPARP